MSDLLDPAPPADQPPVPKRVEQRRELHGRAVVDPYAWLRDRDDPDTFAYLEAENAYAGRWMAPLEDLQERLFAEMRGRILETDLTVPARKGPWWYYSRTEEGRQYAIHCRRDTEDEGGTEHVLLDENALAGEGGYFSLGAFDVSPSHRLLAYSTDTTGAEIHRMRFRDLDTGADLPDEIERTHYGTAWSSDDRYLFYTVPDDAFRSHQVWRHELGRPASEDVCVLDEPDQRFDLGVGNDRAGDLVLFASSSRTTTEAWFLPASDPTGALRVVEPRRHGHEYHVEAQGGRLLIMTNDGAENFRLVEAPLDAPGAEHWRELLPHRDDTMLEGVDAFAHHVVVYERHEALPRLRVIGPDGGQRVIQQPEAVYHLGPAGNPEYDTRTLRFTYTSMATPTTVYDEHLDSGERTLKKRQPVLGHFDPEEYETVREWAVAPDGVRVPISLVRRRDVARDGTAPCLLYGYGSYEINIPPTFSALRLSLLDRGVVFAIAHVRGGGELGRRWYEDGKLLRKRNTFADFIAAAEHLVAEGWTTPARLAIRGGSAGGLLVGASTNLRPDLFRAVVAEVPFVDVLNTMLDPSLPLTVGEYEEWGNPEEPEYFDYIASYSPYDNVGSGRYPAFFVTAGLNDPRVSYHEPAKWVARLRERTAPDGPVLLRTEMSAGHGGPSGRYDAWRDEARVHAFLLTVLGVEAGARP